MARPKAESTINPEDWLKAIHKEIGENDANQGVSDWLTTGYLPLNKIMSGRYDGGFPVGRMTEVFGASSSGKTLMCVMAGIETQRKGGLFVFLDYEHAFYLDYAVKLGLDISPEKWIYKQPTTAEEGFKAIEHICNIVNKCKIDKPVTIVLDSVASMVPGEALEAGVDKQNMRTKMSLASLASSALPSITNFINKTNVTLLCINQTRTNPGIMFGDKTVTPGGDSWKFYASMRVKVSKSGKILDDDDLQIGENVTVTIVKNKTAPPFQKCHYESSYTEGINLYSSHINALHEAGLLGDIKGWLVLDGTKYRKDQLEVACRNDPKIYLSLLRLFKNVTAEPVKPSATIIDEETGEVKSIDGEEYGE
ncbi:MAG: hypothetical protein EOL88_08345 [Bacteroidia bacterium]|nr:hypothetical protein [Bacteroidia bacterium]